MNAVAMPDHWPLESDWSPRLRQVFEQPFFQSLQEFVDVERDRHTVFPPASAVFNSFRYTPFAETKVVILGQDPYHGPGQAHGLSFSVTGDCRIPPSLRNIFKELSQDIGIPQPGSGDLTSWARQGVLLLNTVLTVRERQPNSHRGQGWEDLTDAVIQQLGQQQEFKIGFLLWGKPAEKKTSLISDYHTVITSPHPSPLSAHRGFFGSRPFSRINEALTAAGRTGVRWESVCASSSV
jgi:uracil-DNA glycosylase